MRLSDDKAHYGRLLEFKKKGFYAHLSSRFASVELLLLNLPIFAIFFCTLIFVEYIDSVYVKFLTCAVIIVTIISYTAFFNRNVFGRFFYFFIYFPLLTLFFHFASDENNSSLFYMYIALYFFAAIVYGTLFFQIKSREKSVNAKFTDVFEFLDNIWKYDRLSSQTILFSFPEKQSSFDILRSSLRDKDSEKSDDMYRAILFDDVVLIFNNPMTVFELLEGTEFNINRAHTSNHFEDEDFFINCNSSFFRNKVLLKAEDYNKYVAWKNKQMGFGQKDAAAEPAADAEEKKPGKAIRNLFLKSRSK